MPSVKPSTLQKYCRRGNIDKRGGGLVLECQYILELETGIDRQIVLSEIQSLLNKIEGNETAY